MVTELLVVAPVYYPDMGGGALASYLIVDLLAKVEGLKLAVLTGNKKPKPSKGVNYFYDPLLKIIDKKLFSPQLLSKRYEKLISAHDIVYIAYAFPLISVAKKLGKKTIVHLHDYRPISLSGVALAGAEKSSNFGLVKDSFTISLMQKRGVKGSIKNVVNVPYTMQIRRWVSMADVILSVSQRHSEIISKYMPTCQDRIKVLYNPLPAPQK